MVGVVGEVGTVLATVASVVVEKLRFVSIITITHRDWELTQQPHL
jgi:hypothetical protein